MSLPEKPHPLQGNTFCPLPHDEHLLFLGHKANGQGTLFLLSRYPLGGEFLEDCLENVEVKSIPSVVSTECPPCLTPSWCLRDAETQRLPSGDRRLRHRITGRLLVSSIWPESLVKVLYVYIRVGF